MTLPCLLKPLLRILLISHGPLHVPLLPLTIFSEIAHPTAPHIIPVVTIATTLTTFIAVALEVSSIPIAALIPHVAIDWGLVHFNVVIVVY